MDKGVLRVECSLVVSDYVYRRHKNDFTVTVSIPFLDSPSCVVYPSPSGTFYRQIVF